MQFEELKNYRSLAVDYSIIKEFGGTSTFSDFLNYITSESIDIFVNKTFKLSHYCVLHQADDKNAACATAMRDFCSLLLASKKLHTVQATETCDYISKISTLPSVAILSTKTAVFTKRLLEKKPDFSGDIIIATTNDFVIYHGITDFINNYPEVEISPLASSNKFLDASVFCNVGDIVVTGKKANVELTKRVSSGAEGMVFLTNNPRVVAKIYHKGMITPLRWSKLSKMVSTGIRSVGICWPMDLLFYKGIPVGYTMSLGKGKTLSNVFDGPDAMLENFPEWKRIDVVNTLVDILEKYIYLHMHDIVAGDIQMKNALLYSASSIYLIDMDSAQIGNLPCPVGTEEFTDPRMWGKNFSEFLRKLEDEDYSMAMLTFSILFCGLHPYATRNGAETLREEILEKNFPYTLDNSNEEHIPRGGYNYIWAYIPEDIRNMLYGVFKEGKRFEALEWYEAALNYKEALSTRKYEDEEAYKVFPKMSYKVATVASDNSAISQSDFAKNAAFKSRMFTNENNPFGDNSGGGSVFSNPNPVNVTPPKTETRPSGGQYVPKANGNVPNSTPTPEPPKEEKQGLFKKFKKGLF